METRKTKSLHCKCCLTKNDLTVVSSDKQKIINSILNISSKTTKDDRICINCSSTLSCIDKFRENSSRAHTILKKCMLRNTFLSSVTDESVNSAFDTILNWMNDVTVILKYLTDDVKEEDLTTVVEEDDVESEHDYENIEAVHEEEMFVGHLSEDNIKMEIEALEDEEEPEVKVEPDFESKQGSGTDYDDENDYDQVGISDPEAKDRKINLDPDRYKKYTCDLCGKKYACRRDLTYHINVHSGINPYECGIDGCTKAYPHPRTLKVHQREVHQLLNGEKVEPMKEPINNDPEFEEKLDELRDGNFAIENFYAEERRGHKRPYQCRICSRFYNKTEFVYHRNTHLGLKPFQCELCEKTFTNPFELQKHNRKKHESDNENEDQEQENDEDDKTLAVLPENSMQNTDEDTSTYRALEKYFVDKLRGCRRAYQCPTCKKCYSRGELKYHLNTHNNIKPYACAIEDCDRMFASPRDMRVHARKFHKIKVHPVKDYSMKNTRTIVYKREMIEKPYGQEYNKINVICTVCGKSVRKKHFREHYQTHIKSDFSCPYEKQGCTETFRNKMKLTSHIQAKHDPDYLPSSAASCMCEHCGKQLTKAQLKYHMNLHLGLTPYTCEYPNCNESYRSPNLLRQHIAGYHLKQMRYKCQYCSKRFNTKEEQEKHKDEDCGVKTATCHLCGRTMNRFSLKNHLLIHTGEKNWICEYEGCGKAFLRRDKLQQHKKLHSTENHYTCSICNMGFKYKSWLDTHVQKKHTGVEGVVMENVVY